MRRWPLALGSMLIGVTALAAAQAAGGTGTAGNDRDRDGLDDRIERELAETLLPSIHEADTAALHDDCLEPRRRPILYRARPREAAHPERLAAITYVLLYARDCGALGHAGDGEAFTVFASRDNGRGSWRAVGAVAIAHRGAEAERTTIGDGRDIWVSRNKHANYAQFDACADTDLANDVCARTGPPPRGRLLVNVGEPSAPLRDTVGDLLPAARHVRIWQHQSLLGAGALTSLFFLPAAVSIAPDLTWPSESMDSLSRKDGDA